MAMSEDKQKVLDKLAKLMTLGKAEAHNPEGQAALRMAAKLMARHQIEESEIDLREGKVSGTTIFEDEEGWEGLCDQGGKRQWVAWLAVSIADTFNAKIYTSTYQGTVHFLATASDLETCLYFMDVIFSHVEKEARKACPKPGQWKDRNVFGQAAWSEIDQRLREMKKEMDEAVKEYSGGYDLMVLKDNVVSEAVEDIFKSRGYIKAKNTAVNSSNEKLKNLGRIAGKNCPLNRAIKA